MLIPPAVYQELTRSDVGPPLIDRASCSWLVVEPARDTSRVAQLRAELESGEAEAIALALEKQADLILVDERLGRQVAMALGLRVTGLLGVLAEAKRAGLIERAKPVIEDLQERAGFWISAELVAQVLSDLDEA